MIKQYSSLTISDSDPVLKKAEDIQVCIVNDGMALPLKFLDNSPANGSGGVLDTQGNFVSASGMTESYLQYGKAYDIDRHSAPKQDEEVIWFGLFINHWGHFLIELIGRMWYLLEHYKNQKII